jgi:hypothetical protein
MYHHLLVNIVVIRRLRSRQQRNLMILHSERFVCICCDYIKYLYFLKVTVAPALVDITLDSRKVTDKDGKLKITVNDAATGITKVCCFVFVVFLLFCLYLQTSQSAPLVVTTTTTTNKQQQPIRPPSNSSAAAVLSRKRLAMDTEVPRKTSSSSTTEALSSSSSRVSFKVAPTKKAKE